MTAVSAEFRTVVGVDGFYLFYEPHNRFFVHSVIGNQSADRLVNGKFG